MIAGFVIIAWPLYYFHTYNYPPERQRHDTETLLASNTNSLKPLVIWASDKPVMRAAAQYGLGLLMVTQRAAGGNTVYFRGNVTTSAGSSYFPFVYLIKEPLPWLILLVIAIMYHVTRIKMKPLIHGTWNVIHGHLDEVAMLLWLAIYWAVSIHSTLNIGVRHLLPVFPFMIILVSGQVIKFWKFFAFRFSLFALIAWYILENLLVFPYYLTYFNQLVGGSANGHRYVVDSNLDWGQDLKRFADWTKQNNIKKIELDYFGWADQAYYLGDKFVWLTSDKYKSEGDFIAHNPSDGWIAVSATFLMNESKAKYAWLYAHQPVTVIGNSIFVYRIL